MGKIKAIIDRFEGDKVVLILSDKQNLVLNKKDISAELKEGDSVILDISKDIAETANHHQDVKKLLTELLRKDEK